MIQHAPINKFTFPLLFNKGYKPIISSFFQKKDQVSLGRWHLKHQEQQLDNFYQQIPDPGYFNYLPFRPNLLKQDINSSKPQN